MFTKIAVLSLVTLAVSADGGSHHHHEPAGYAYDSPPAPTYKSEGAPFSFWWAVDEPYHGNVYSHHSESDGMVTKGEYKTLLPDGRTQIVKYTSDDYTGFVTEITYEGEAKPYEAPERSYHAPERTYEAPTNTYQAPERTYEAPRTSYSAPSHN